MWWLNSKQLSHIAQCYVILMLLLNISTTRNHLFLKSAFNRPSILLTFLCLFHPPGIILFSFMASLTWPGSFFGNASPPLTIPSTSNHIFLCQGAFNRAMIMLDISNLPLTIPSTRNPHFPVYGAITILVITGLSFIIESIWNHLFLLHHVFTRVWFC